MCACVSIGSSACVLAHLDGHVQVEWKNNLCLHSAHWHEWALVGAGERTSLQNCTQYCYEWHHIGYLNFHIFSVFRNASEAYSRVQFGCYAIRIHTRQQELSGIVCKYFIHSCALRAFFVDLHSDALRVCSRVREIRPTTSIRGKAGVIKSDDIVEKMHLLSQTATYPSGAFISFTHKCTHTHCAIPHLVLLTLPIAYYLWSWIRFKNECFLAFACADSRTKNILQNLRWIVWIIHSGEFCCWWGVVFECWKYPHLCLSLKAIKKYIISIYIYFQVQFPFSCVQNQLNYIFFRYFFVVFIEMYLKLTWSTKCFCIYILKTETESIAFDHILYRPWKLPYLLL